MAAESKTFPVDWLLEWCNKTEVDWNNFQICPMQTHYTVTNIRELWVTKAISSEHLPKGGSTTTVWLFSSLSACDSTK